MKPKTPKPTFYRLRRFVKRRVVSSQIFSSWADCQEAGRAWLAQDGAHTVAYSETKSPKV